jgi:hypothetical protein
VLLGVVVVATTAVTLYGPIPQPADYHAFADGRALLGVPNFADTLSNVPFLAVGLAGLFLLRRGVPPGGLPALRPAYVTLFAGTALLGPGSAWYHLAPSNPTLTWDRLPMTVAFMSFLTIVIGEHVGVRLARRLHLPLLLAGVLSVVYWRATDSGDGGDLRPYVLVQFVPMLLVPATLLLYRCALEPTWHLWALVACYGAAKGLELADEPVLAATGFVGGHTLKHLASAAGLAFLLPALVRRRPPESR